MAAAIAAGLVALGLGRWDGEPPSDLGRTVDRPASNPPGAPIGAEAVALDSEPAREWTRQAEEVTRACDLPVETTCEDGACVALLHGPDLDHALGWIGLVLTSPRFVASTLLRDVGVDAETLPCGAAIEDFVAHGDEVPMIELADGTELWCATDGAGDTALCDRAAAERYGASGFAVPGVRRLSFDPDG